MCLGWTGAERGSVTGGGCLSVSQGPLRAARGHSGLDPTVHVLCRSWRGARGLALPRRRVHARAGQQTPLVTGQMAEALGSGAVLNFALVGRRQPWTETKVAWLCSSKALLTFIYKNWGWAGLARGMEFLSRFLEAGWAEGVLESHETPSH